MRVDYHSLPDDPTKTDAPPSYGTIQPEGHCPEESGSDKISPVSPVKKPIDMRNPRDISNSCFNVKSASSSRTCREIRNTVRILLWDIIEGSVSTRVALSILSNCAKVCMTHGISFSDTLQQRNLGSHTALYWVILRRSPPHHPEVEMNQGPDLLTALIGYASPLKEPTITEIRQACLALTDQRLFQKLRQCPGVARMPGLDQMLLGVTIPPDEIEVEELKHSFTVNFVVPQFRKRMAVSESILLEFIARGVYYYRRYI
jgi:hypothetical protein